MNLTRSIQFCNQLQKSFAIGLRRNSSSGYTQGQYAKENSQIREYFYFISEEGYLFLDDTKHKNFTSCFKDKQFLKFFFDRLQFNTTDRYKNEFPYLSRCGYERNYIRTDDCPLVYTHVIDDKISYNYGGDLMAVDFKVEDIIMCPLTGRIYYPSIDARRFGELGLVRSKLSIELSKHFIFDGQSSSSEKSSNNQFEEPDSIEWNNKIYKLSKRLKPILIERNRRSF